MSNSALSFVGQIQTEYREACKAESGALQHAIKCGNYLTLAKENVKAEKGKWLPWLATNCPEIPQTTASLYMRLAENETKIEKAKSIREALGLLTGREGAPRRKRERKGEDEGAEDSEAEGGEGSDEGEESPRAGKGKGGRQDGGLEEELKAVAPDELFLMLVEVWEDQQFQDFMRLMGNYLQQKKPAALPPQPTFTSIVPGPRPN
jgi:hypothetical protein